VNQYPKRHYSWAELIGLVFAVIMVALLLSACQTTRPDWASVDHRPPPGLRPSVPVSVRYVTAGELPGMCGLDPDRLLGCSRLWPALRCDVWIRDDLPATQRAAVLAHELAHCAGWNHE